MAPTLILIPGSFGKSEMYDPVALVLRQKGYTIHVLDPPCYPKSYVKGAPPPSMFDDAKFISEFVSKIADETGEDIVLMAHSYGGIPASQSLSTISKSARSASGKKGGVTRLAYLTAVVPKEGNNLVTTIAGGAPAMSISEDGWLLQTDFVATAAMCFNSLSDAEGLEHAKNFERHSSLSFMDALSYAGYKDVPVSWFFCEDDKCVVPEVQQVSIDTIEESWKGTEREGNKVDVKRVKCDHVPVFSAKEELIAWMEELLA
ncbi:Alpha/beta hydrolase fold-1 [Phaeosphaeria sp. MPI-PUGE-AT-0046c]|nr:Alpha/beta hydrolase fold-1 [Phaeosphaeria sp. MPI-PUGE-AT-0046c]